MTFQFLNHENAAIKFCFLFGKNLTSSPSPELHNFWFKKYGFNVEYKKCVVQTVHEFIDIICTLNHDENFLGGNVTMPFKQTVFELDKDVVICSETVKNSASANTLFRDQNGFFHAANTDVIGIQATLDILCPRYHRFDQVIVYGGGGASASCIFKIFECDLAPQVVCVTRDPDLSFVRFGRSEFFRKYLESKKLVFKKLSDNEQLCDEQRQMSRGTKKSTLLMNTLPLGQTDMYPEHNSWCVSLLNASKPENTFYFDLVYDYTDACDVAQKRGIQFQNGRRMFETQAAASFKLWTGVDVQSHA